MSAILPLRHHLPVSMLDSVGSPGPGRPRTSHFTMPKLRESRVATRKGGPTLAFGASGTAKAFGFPFPASPSAVPRISINLGIIASWDVVLQAGCSILLSAGLINGVKYLLALTVVSGLVASIRIPRLFLPLLPIVPCPSLPYPPDAANTPCNQKGGIGLK